MQSDFSKVFSERPNNLPAQEWTDLSTNYLPRVCLPQPH